jgi:hypothetical protein
MHDTEPAPNPFRSIWTRPRATIQHVVDSNPELYLFPLAVAFGIAQSLDNAVMRNLGDRLGLIPILAIALIAGPVTGIIGLYLWAALTRWAGKWIGGRASTRDIRAAIVWGGVPAVAAALLWIPLIVLLGREAFTSKSPAMDASVSLAFTVLAVSVVKMAAGIWTVVVYLKCLGQVQGFSAWRALGNSVLAFLALVVPLAVVILCAVLLLQRGA